MPVPLPPVDIRAPPPTFDEIVDWLERWSYGLVLLDEYALDDLRAAIRAVESAVHAHRGQTEVWVRTLGRLDEAVARSVRVVLSDHEWFETSLDQFWWFFRVVERENHGGHRQALGQYGRLLAEALRRHRLDERTLEPPRSCLGRLPAPSAQETLIS